MSTGQIIGPYQLTAPADGNPFGPYWLATHLDTGETFRLQWWGYGCSQSEYLQSVEQIARWRHPNILPVIEFGTVDSEMAWTVTRPQTGVTLHGLTTQATSPDDEHAYRMATEVLSALESAHAQNIAHGSLDAKSCIIGPSGILVDGWGGVYPTQEVMASAQARDRQSALDILGQLFPNPSPALAAILSSPPVSIAALRSDFEAARKAMQTQTSSLLPSPEKNDPAGENTMLNVSDSGQSIPDRDENTLEIGPPISGQTMPDVFSYSQPHVTEGPDESMEPVRAPSQMDQISAEDSIDGTSTVNENPWLDLNRVDVQNSNRYSPQAGPSDSWGVIDGPGDVVRSYASHSPVPLGLRVHTVADEEEHLSRDSQPNHDGPSWLKWIIVLGIIGGAGLIVSSFLQPSLKAPAESQAPTKTEEDELLDLIKTQSPTQEDEKQIDASIMPSPQSVLVRFSPVEVTVKRADTGEVICENARECALPINVDYRASHPKYDVMLISGDDLYDRRISGRWRRVMQPKTPGLNNGR